MPSSLALSGVMPIARATAVPDGSASRSPRWRFRSASECGGSLAIDRGRSASGPASEVSICRLGWGAVPGPGRSNRNFHSTAHCPGRRRKPLRLDLTRLVGGSSKIGIGRLPVAFFTKSLKKYRPRIIEWPKR